MKVELPQPISKLEIFYKRFIKVDEQKNMYKIIYTSKGLENYVPPASLRT